MVHSTVKTVLCVGDPRNGICYRLSSTPRYLVHMWPLARNAMAFDDKADIPDFFSGTSPPGDPRWRSPDHDAIADLPKRVDITGHLDAVQVDVLHRLLPAL